MTERFGFGPGTTTAYHRPELVRESAGPTGVARSWAELISTMHGGIAILDDDSRVEVVSSGFLTACGLDAHSVVGRDIRNVFPILGGTAPPLLDRALGGELVGLGQRVHGADGTIRWVRITIVALTESSDRAPLIVFVQDTTAISSATAARREATLRLTEVEEQELDRLSRDLHDGPVQLLTALGWRLSLLAPSKSVGELREQVDVVAAGLRHILSEMSDHDELSVGQTLERWLAPFLEGSRIEMGIHDHLTTPANRSLTQVAFVFVLEMVRATRRVGRPRRQTVSLDSERGGYRMLLTTTTSGASSGMRDATATQYRAMREYARSLGGTMETELTPEAVRTFSVWLPHDTEATVDDHDIADVPTPTSLRPAEWIRRVDRSCPPDLEDAIWEQLVRAAPEPITEFDAALNWLLVNTAYEAVEGSTEAEILAGEPLRSRFRPAEVSHVEHPLAKIGQGEPVCFEWSRVNADDEVRFVRVSASPRLDDRGQVCGAFAVLEDLSDLHHLELLQGAALDDLARTRHQKRQDTFARLRQPIAGLQSLIDPIRELEQTVDDPAALRELRVGLVDTIGKLTRSLDLLDVPDLAERDHEQALRESLSWLLTDVDLTYRTDLDRPLSAARAEVLFRIAREAVANAVFHGSADRVQVEVSTDDAGVRMEIRNDGARLDPSDLDASPDHLGVRLMTQRARSHGGTCVVAPASAGGTVVTVRLPAEPTNQ